MFHCSREGGGEGGVTHFNWVHVGHEAAGMTLWISISWWANGKCCANASCWGWVFWTELNTLQDTLESIYIDEMCVYQSAREITLNCFLLIIQLVSYPNGALKLCILRFNLWFLAKTFNFNFLLSQYPTTSTLFYPPSTCPFLSSPPFIHALLPPLSLIPVWIKTTAMPACSWTVEIH